MDNKFRKKYKKFLMLLFFIVVTFAVILTFSDINSKYKDYAGKIYNKTVDVVHYSVDKKKTVESKNTENDIDNRDEEDEVEIAIPVGEPIGIYVKTDGVMVVDIGEVTGADGHKYSPCLNKLKAGDYIVSVNGTEVNDKTTLVNMINESGKEGVILGIRRDNSEIYLVVNPVLGKGERYMLGLWVKDDISGIGTLTYITKEEFGALGHSVNDNDTGAMFNISDGAIFPTKIVNIKKSDKKMPGRIEGLINFTNQSILGRINCNDNYGISGTVTDEMLEQYGNREWLPIGKKEDVYEGRAYILSSISGKPEYYSIEITKITYSNKNKEMGMGIEICVTDERLINMTGGIVQGMSGTPIIQDGKLIGAVTHVFLKDSTKGYGIFIESMVK